MQEEGSQFAKEMLGWTEAPDQKKIEEQNVIDFFIKEDRQKGNISWDLIKKMVRMSKGFCYNIIAVFLMIGGVIIYAVTNIMREDIGSKLHKKENLTPELILFTSLSISCDLMGILASFMLFYGLLTMSRKLHAKMTFKLLHA